MTIQKSTEQTRELWQLPEPAADQTKTASSEVGQGAINVVGMSGDR